MKQKRQSTDFLALILCILIVLVFFRQQEYCLQRHHGLLRRRHHPATARPAAAAAARLASDRRRIRDAVRKGPAGHVRQLADQRQGGGQEDRKGGFLSHRAGDPGPVPLVRQRPQRVGLWGPGKIIRAAENIRF